MSVARRISEMEASPTMAVDAKAKALKAAGEPVIGFGAGEPDFPTPDHIVEAARRAALSPASHRYSPATGQMPLREVVAAQTTETSGHEYAAGHVVITNGGKHALYNIFMALLDPGDEVIIPAPYWVSFPEQVKLAGGVPVPVTTTTDSGFQVSVEQLEAIRTDRTKALIFVSPSNPTGAVYGPERTAEIGAWAAEHGIWVVTDEIYQRLVYGDAVFTSLPKVAPEAAERTIITSGVAKTYAMTGWRVGWAVAPTAIASGMAKLQSQVTSNVCNVAQAAALEALTGPQEPAEEMRQAFDRRRRIAVEALSAIPGVEVHEPEGAFYVFPSFEAFLGREIAGRQVDTTLDLASVMLEEAKIAVVPGEAFGAPGYARMAYALSDEDLRDGIDRIARLLA